MGFSRDRCEIVHLALKAPAVYVWVRAWNHRNAAEERTFSKAEVRYAAVSEGPLSRSTPEGCGSSWHGTQRAGGQSGARCQQQARPQRV